MPKWGAYFSLNVCLAGDDSLARTKAADAIAPAIDAPPACKNSRRCTATTPGTIVETANHFLSLTSAQLESNHFASAGVQSVRELRGGDGRSGRTGGDAFRLAGVYLYDQL